MSNYQFLYGLRMKKFNTDQNTVSDVCFLTEGTYPYVTGGVSSWIHQIISAMPELTFSLYHVSPSSDVKLRFRYNIPDNVVALVNVYLHDTIIHENKTPGKKHRKVAYSDILNFHKDLRTNKSKAVLNHL